MTYVTLSAPRRRSRIGLSARLATAFALIRQRRALAKLDDAALLDIGVSRAAAQSEAKRPFWDAPASWLR
ncbi:DUF1127 domain-containing protein [Phaeobacter sp. PT47_59]|uniref:DUF1127 domain-containing protein n=1 Tax=Phaeobacter sp. PT47_59 TaxID=3029979 RepID=UPI00237FEA43|nr:DUF1127 domain-containing protein [Phaeobacter sp. PT47_59]MDE4173538.1 DUF1127 domain-containing protein [Phaeobacter sp. PT47_59]